MAKGWSNAARAAALAARRAHAKGKTVVSKPTTGPAYIARVRAAQRARAKRYTAKYGLRFSEAAISHTGIINPHPDLDVGLTIGSRKSVAKALKAVRAHNRSHGIKATRVKVAKAAANFMIYGKRAFKK